MLSHGKTKLRFFGSANLITTHNFKQHVIKSRAPMRNYLAVGVSSNVIKFRVHSRQLATTGAFLLPIDKLRFPGMSQSNDKWVINCVQGMDEVVIKTKVFATKAIPFYAHNLTSFGKRIFICIYYSNVTGCCTTLSGFVLLKRWSNRFRIQMIKMKTKMQFQFIWSSYLWLSFLWMNEWMIEIRCRWNDSNGMIINLNAFIHSVHCHIGIQYELEKYLFWVSFYYLSVTHLIEITRFMHIVKSPTVHSIY